MHEPEPEVAWDRQCPACGKWNRAISYGEPPTTCAGCGAWLDVGDDPEWQRPGDEWIHVPIDSEDF